jgi:hypothetical protein
VAPLAAKTMPVDTKKTFMRGESPGVVLSANTSREGVPMANEELLAQLAALGGTGILILAALSLVLILPVFVVMFSKRVSGGRKVFWVVMMGTFSWLAYVPYLIMTRAKDARTAPPGPAAE